MNFLRYRSRLLAGSVAGAAAAVMLVPSGAVAGPIPSVDVTDDPGCTLTAGEPQLFGWTLQWTGEQTCEGGFAPQAIEVSLQRWVDGAWWDYATDAGPATTDASTTVEKAAYLGIPGVSIYRTKVIGWSQGGKLQQVQYSKSVEIDC